MHFWSVIAFILAIAGTVIACACAIVIEKLQRFTYLIWAFLGAAFVAVLIPAVFKLKS